MSFIINAEFLQGDLQENRKLLQGAELLYYRVYVALNQTGAGPNVIRESTHQGAGLKVMTVRPPGGGA